MASLTNEAGDLRHSTESSRASTVSLNSLQCLPQASFDSPTCPEKLPFQNSETIFRSLDDERKRRLARTDSVSTIFPPPPAFLPEFRLKYVPKPKEIPPPLLLPSGRRDGARLPHFLGDIVTQRISPPPPPLSTLPPPLPSLPHPPRPPDSPRPLEPAYIKLDTYHRQHPGVPCIVTSSRHPAPQFVTDLAASLPRPRRPSPPSSLQIQSPSQPALRPPSVFQPEDSVSISSSRPRPFYCCNIL